MKRKWIALSRRYVKALRSHLEQSSPASLQSALGLGRQAAALDLETLDLARIHEDAVTDLEISDQQNVMTKRAKCFFDEAITPIEKTHCAALKANDRLSQLNQALSKRKLDLATCARSLRIGIAQRRALEQALKTSERHYSRLLKESRRLQKYLRHTSHQVVRAQEGERKKISRELHNEVAQTLLGIHVRLVTLKNAARVRAEDLKNEIATTRRIVVDSVKTMNRFAREFGQHHAL